MSSIQSINESVRHLTQLTCKDTASQTARLKHFALICIVFLTFLSSIVLSFIKSYQSIYGELTSAKVTELIALDIDSAGHFIVMSSLLILFHFQNKEPEKEGEGDRERALSSQMVRLPSKDGNGDHGSYKDVRRGFLDTITTNAIKKKSLNLEATELGSKSDIEISEPEFYDQPLDSDEEQLDEWEMLYQKQITKLFLNKK